MNIIKQFARWIVSLLFIFSGLIKINDPIGTAIKLEEYFHVFAEDIAGFFIWFVPASLYISVFLSVFEIVIGLTLLIAYRMRLTSYCLLILIVFFTFLTFYSAYFNKVTDCGCFGDAIKLTPWESFSKDILLLILIVIIFIYRNAYQSIFKYSVSTAIVIISKVTFLLIGIYAIMHLPYIDFRSYAVGNHIPSLMKESAPLKYLYLAEKEGEIYEFDEYPRDTSYMFKSMELVNPEAQPKITSLDIWRGEEDFTDAFLQGNKLIIIIQDVTKANTTQMDNIRSIIESGDVHETWLLTSSGEDTFEKFRHQHQLPAPFVFGDATELKTMIRSNPGIILLQDGMVRGKWHHNDTPTKEKLIALIGL